MPIQECGEPLVPIPPGQFSFVQPHPYAKVGAPYGDRSPFCLRQSVIERLLAAHRYLQTRHPGWKIQIFDAYRPVAVQQYMVDYTFAELLQQRGLKTEHLLETEQQELWNLVYEFWAIPDLDPKQPPPHSTGGAVDVTLVDGTGQVVEMGTPIDELSPRSHPDHFASSQNSEEQQFHSHRQILSGVMSAAGFWQHPGEWWHFCYGDQMWAWLTRQQSPDATAIARYGRVPE